MDYLVKVDRHDLIRKTQTVSYVRNSVDKKFMQSFQKIKMKFDKPLKQLLYML
jgi:hypothetical protein